MYFKKALFVAVCFIAVSSVSMAQQESPQSGVEHFLSAIRSMDFPVTDASVHDQKVKEAAKYLNLRSMGEKALDAHWESMTSDQQDQFINLLWKLIEAIAYPRTKKFLGEQTIQYQETKPLAQGMEVSSVVEDTEADLNVPIVYHLSNDGGDWVIFDIFMDGVSMIEDLQYQFDKMIEDGSVQTLLDRMNERLIQAQNEIAG